MVKDNPVRVVDIFVDDLDLTVLGFEGMTPAATGRPAYHPAMMLKLGEHIASYLQDLDTADRHEGEAVEARSGRLVEKVERLRAQMAMLKAMEVEVEASPDGQISLTDPDARAMATSGRGSGIVGYNVQSAVEGEHHLIVAHEVVMTGSDKNQLAKMAGQAKDAMGAEALDVLADRGYFSGEEILAGEALGATPFVPKTLTSGAKANGRFGKQDFVYLPDQDVYRCPAGSLLPYHMTVVERGMTLHRYWDRASCSGCSIKAQCTPSVERKVTRWEHEAVIDALQTRMDLRPRAMRERRSLRSAAWTGVADTSCDSYAKSPMKRAPSSGSLSVRPSARRFAYHAIIAALISDIA